LREWQGVFHLIDEVAFGADDEAGWGFAHAALFTPWGGGWLVP
jgi:hypothetical protein